MRLALFLLILILLVSLRFVFSYSAYRPYREGETVHLTTTLLREPDNDSAIQKLTITPTNREGLYIRMPAYPKFGFGESIEIIGAVTKKTVGQTTLSFVTNPQVTKISTLQSSLLSPLAAIRQQLIQLYSESLPPIGASLLLGITFGIKQHMPKEFVLSLQQTGVVHVIAASGMNVTMTASFFSSLFGLFFKRQQALLLSVVSILLYAVLAGLEPSIVRATLMGGSVFLAQIYGRQYLALYVLGLTGLSMALYDPSIVGDVGFQLSFVATLGILYLKPLFALLEKKVQILKKIVIFDDITTTLAAQLSTLPILLFHFGSYSLTSILVNGLVLWMVPLLMILGGIGGLIGLLLPSIGKLVLYTSLPLLFVFEQIVRFFSQWSWQMSVTPNWFVVAGYYLLLAAGVLLFKQKVRK